MIRRIIFNISTAACVVFAVATQVQTLYAHDVAPARLLAQAQADTPAAPPSNTPLPTIKTRLVPDTILIGDQVIMEVDIDKDIAQEIQLPQFDDKQITKEIEFLGIDGVDTLSHDGRRVKLRAKYRLTSFTAGTHAFSGFGVLSVERNRTDTIKSFDIMSLVVSTYEIDTTQQTPVDIKRPISTPLIFAEIRDLVIWGSIAAVLLAAIIYLIIRYVKRRRGTQRPKKLIPAHIVAIRSLERLHSRKLWQNNRYKEYYSALSDIIRTYIEDRYRIGAMEMTTDQIMDAVLLVNDKRLTSKLRELLELADLVKFAKFAPPAQENEQSYFDAYFYIEETKDTAEAAPSGDSLDSYIKDEVTVTPNDNTPSEHPKEDTTQKADSQSNPSNDITAH